MKGLMAQDHATLLSEIDYLLGRVRDVYELLARSYGAADAPRWQAGRVLHNLGALRNTMVSRAQAEYPEGEENPSVAG